MHPQHTVVLALAMAVIMRSTAAKSVEPTENLLPSAEPTQNATVLSTGSEETPRVQSLVGRCTGEDQGFCLNGQCTYHSDLKRPTCRCPWNYMGDRCEHMLLGEMLESSSNREQLIAIGGGVALLLCAIAVVLYCCLKKRCERKKPHQMSHSHLAI